MCIFYGKIVPIFARTLLITSFVVTGFLYIPFKICTSIIAVVASSIGDLLYYIVTGKTKSQEIFEFFYFNIEKSINESIMEPYFKMLFKYSELDKK